MPKRETHPVGAPCWIDLFTSDPDKARSFYGDLFGWTFKEAGEEFGGYINIFKDGVGVAGCMRNDGSGNPDVWSVYLTSDDARATVEAAAATGAQVHVPAMDVADLGTMVIVSDPGGAAIGIWQPGLHKGFGVLAEPGAPAWFELQTREYDASVEFYRTVFLWDVHVAGDTPEFRYTTYGSGDAQQAGIMDGSAYLPEGVPAKWSVYFGTADTDASLSRIVDLGGTVVDPAVDTPYGRLATAADPTGATFKLVAGA